MSFGNDTYTVRHINNPRDQIVCFSFNCSKGKGRVRPMLTKLCCIFCIILEAFRQSSFRKICNINIQKIWSRGSSLCYSTVTGGDGTGTDTDGIVNCTEGIGIGTDSTDGTRSGTDCSDHTETGIMMTTTNQVNPKWVYLEQRVLLQSDPGARNFSPCR